MSNHERESIYSTGSQTADEVIDHDRVHGWPFRLGSELDSVHSIVRLKCSKPHFHALYQGNKTFMNITALLQPVRMGSRVPKYAGSRREVASDSFSKWTKSS